MASSEQWKIFFHKCFDLRIDEDEFKDLSKLMLVRHPIGEEELIGLLFDSRGAAVHSWDPLLPLYIDELCKSGRIKSSTALKGLLNHSPIREKEGNQSKISVLMTDIKVIQNVVLLISSGVTPQTVTDAAELFSVAVEWIGTIVAWHNQSVDSQDTGGLMSNSDAVSLFDSLGILLAALSGTPKGLETLSSEYKTGIFQGIWSSMALGAPSILT